MKQLRILLATIALGAGLLAALAGEPVPESATDEVTAWELAEWIRARRPGLLLLDLRSATEGAVARIPGAQPISGVARARPSAHVTVVVFEDTGIDAAVASELRRRWNLPDLLRLRGGVAAWNSEVMFPVVRADASARQREEFSRRARLSRYFGGNPQVLEPGASNTPQRSRQGC